MPQRVDPRILGLPFNTAVPRSIVIRTVAVVLPVWPVVLDVVGHQVTQRKAVVGGDEVNARGDGPVVAIEDVRRARQPLRQLTDSVGVAPPKVADMVAEAIIPFTPPSPEAADLVAVRAHVPGLGNDLDLAQHGVLSDRLLERVILINMVALV